MKGWLVKWTSPDSGYEEAVATVLSARLGVRSVERRLKELYADVTASIQEKLDYAHWKPAQLRFRTRLSRLKDGRVAIDCGHNPFLEARLVSDLRIEPTESGVYVLHYVDGGREMSIVEMQIHLFRAGVTASGLTRLGESTNSSLG